ncbi:MAG: lamin tail domain-containing protein [Anaerolineales bacterium]|nr:lamin tail domain-containing protein [Anaerolineales bacterium]MCK5315999.1 lamin tail domain-containing protein [Anaerolineales bacterium]
MSSRLKISIALVVAISTISAFTVWADTIYLPLIKYDPTSTLVPSPTPTKTPTPTPGVEIIDIEYAPPEPQVDNEYIEIKNEGNDDVDMENWRIKTESGERYDFPKFTLREGRTVKVWSGLGVDGSSNLYWKSQVEIWKDNSDCAYLKDSDKVLIDKYCY